MFETHLSSLLDGAMRVMAVKHWMAVTAVECFHCNQHFSTLSATALIRAVTQSSDRCLRRDAPAGNRPKR
jgi:hypothetical protein